jgi:uncharacterized protein involved in response to NO
VLAAAGQALAAVSAEAGYIVAAAGWLLLLVCAGLFVYKVGLVRPRSQTLLAAGRSGWYEAYVLAAYVWLAVGLLIALGTAIAQAAQVSVPAADLFLAGLHGITVGFISTMIMGMAARIVPAFAATTLYSGRLLMWTWVCVTAGTLLRIPTQALYTTVGGPVVPLLGLSGVIQLAALVLFAWNLWRTLASSATDRSAVATPPLRPAMQPAGIGVRRPGPRETRQTTAPSS